MSCRFHRITRINFGLAELLMRDKARRIAANIAKLRELLTPPDA
jgi:hypothetical protein